MITSVCVYCGSRPGARPPYTEAATALGRHLGESGLTLVYGGAKVGLMGALADGALAAGGRVIGVMPRALIEREVAHAGIGELRTVESMHARKLAMADAADAFIALPGGLGTLEELFEVLTWRQLGWHDKPCGLLDVDGFYDPLLACLHHMVAEQFVAADHVERLWVAREPRALLGRMGARGA